jgi:hypothetical protein
MPSGVEFECRSDGCHLPWIKLRCLARGYHRRRRSCYSDKLATNQRERRFEVVSLVQRASQKERTLTLSRFSGRMSFQGETLWQHRRRLTLIVGDISFNQRHSRHTRHFPTVPIGETLAAGRELAIYRPHLTDFRMARPVRQIFSRMERSLPKKSARADKLIQSAFCPS